MFKIIAFFIITLYAQLFARICILLTCGKPLHDLIISLRREVRAHQTIVIPPLFIDVSVTSQKSERSFILVVRGFRFYRFLRFWCMILELFRQVWYFGIVPTSVVFWNRSDKYVILELFWQVWYFGIVLTSVVFWNCSDKCGILELFRQVWYFGIVPNSVIFVVLRFITTFW
jgi:hypothetical protein